MADGTPGVEGLDAQAREMNGLAVSLLKATTLGASFDRQESNVTPTTDDCEKAFGERGAIEPPYNPNTLAFLFEHSSALRQNVDAYCTNIDAFGHRFEPAINLEASDADQRIAQSIRAERSRLRATPGVPASVVSLPLTPTVEEIGARREILDDMMREEKTNIEQFFKFCCDDMSFPRLRRLLRQDLEVTGNAYVEVLRDGAGRVAEFVYVPSHTMRLMPIDRQATETRVNTKVSDTDYEKLCRRRYFRRYIQIVERRVVYFKEFGDPRLLSKVNGIAYDSQNPNASTAGFSAGAFEDKTRPRLLGQPEEAKTGWAADDGPATEIIHFKIHSARSAYGVPRWIGAVLAILGSRKAEEVNCSYFDNKSVPPLVILVSGGSLSEGSVQRIQDHIDSEVKGKGNFHKTLVIEAESAGGNPLDGASGNVKLDIKPLTDAQQKDALFQAYDERNADKVGQTFRVPPILRGDTDDFNRATADAALEYTEQQVFAPERDDFDFIMNRKILSDMGVRFWTFKSNAPTVKDSVELGTLVKDFVLANILTPEEARELAEVVFGKELKNLDVPWVKQPVPLTLAGIQPTNSDGTAMPGLPDLPAGDDQTEVDEAEKASGSPSLLVTRTAIGYIATVNEARGASGLGPLMAEDGTEDPRGKLTIAAYVEEQKRGERRPPVPAAVDDVLEGRPTTAEKDDLSIADLQDSGALLGLHNGRRRFRRLPAFTTPPNLSAQAKLLLNLRDALFHEEAKQAANAFYAAKKRDLQEGRLTLSPTILRDVLGEAEGEEQA